MNLLPDTAVDSCGICQQADIIGVISANRNGYNRMELGFSSYDLSFIMQDSQGERARYTINVPIVGGDYFPAQAGHKDIVVYNYRGELHDTDIGNVFTEDEDGNNDVEFKNFVLLTESEFFR